ncbi:hypothetical protein E2C01_064170 [Portunus trituberculatus]|uniref:Uncharacterized protein n=1 Tax=Portunus trituberculatus TaxID=210409 RepID=A0A5B7HL03_PORTR|nr:hypothetical protein [Portunus trituberculatus]
MAGDADKPLAETKSYMGIPEAQFVIFLAHAVIVSETWGGRNGGHERGDVLFPHLSCLALTMLAASLTAYCHASQRIPTCCLVLPSL